MAKIDTIDPKWFGKPIYRYHLKGTQNQGQYRCVSTTMTPMEAIKVLKEKVPQRVNMKLYCNGKFIYLYRHNTKGVRNRKTGDVWKTLEDFCIDNDLKRHQATELINRKKETYEYIYIDN